MKSKIVFLGMLILGLTASLLSQTKEISSQEFYRPIRAAYEINGSFRKTSKEEVYENGKLVSITEIVDESLNKETRKYSHLEKSKSNTQKTELIQIGKIYYCRRNDKQWERSEKWCANSGLSGISGIISSKFTVEDAKFNNQNAKLYRQYTTFSFDKNIVSYLEDKFWLNNDGLLVKREVEYGKVEPKMVSSKEVEIVEYNPRNLKIEAPIK
jgi:hypothetical protein